MARDAFGEYFAQAFNSSMRQLVSDTQRRREEERARKDAEAAAEEQRRQWEQQQFVEKRKAAYEEKKRRAEEAEKAAQELRDAENLQKSREAWRKEFEVRMKPYTSSGLASDQDIGIHLNSLDMIEKPGDARSFINSTVDSYTKRAKPQKQRTAPKESATDRKARVIAEAEAKFNGMMKPPLVPDSVAGVVIAQADPADRKMLAAERYSWAPELALRKAEDEYSKVYRYDKPPFMEWARTQSSVAPYVQAYLAKQQGQQQPQQAQATQSARSDEVTPEEMQKLEALERMVQEELEKMR